jgi:hypothetical protein
MGYFNSKAVNAAKVIDLSANSSICIELRALVNQCPIWSSGDLQHLLPRQIACAPMSGESKACYDSAQTVSGLIEMYGGAGLGANAGGVRCANIGKVQVKGIGPTVLAGHSTDKWHKHGACSLQDAIKESIFSELFHLALPHGAARPIAVYDVGTRFATEIGAEKLPGSAPRGLFAREPIVRLAHFMRSSFMDVPGEVAARELPRMRVMVPKLADYICAGIGQPCLEAAVVGLQALYGRVLEQTIAMRLKRLVHGSMIPSNFGVDGRLVDFTTSTTVSTLQPVVVTLGSACSQTQHKQVLDSVADVLFYLTKFDSRCAAGLSAFERATREVLVVANQDYESKVMAAHLQLIGLSKVEELVLPSQIRDRLILAIVKIILQGSTEGHLYYGGDEHSMLAASGKNDLGGALLGAIAARQCESDFILSGVTETCVAFTKTSLAELATAYDHACKFLEQFYQAEGRKSDFHCSLRLSHLIRGMQINANLSGLYRRRIEGEINDLCINSGDISNFIEITLSRWSNVLRFSLTSEVRLAGWLTESDYTLTARGEIELGGKPATVTILVAEVLKLALYRQFAWLNATLFREAASLH